MTRKKDRGALVDEAEQRFDLIRGFKQTDDKYLMKLRRLSSALILDTDPYAQALGEWLSAFVSAEHELWSSPVALLRWQRLLLAKKLRRGSLSRYDQKFLRYVTKKLKEES